MKCFNVNRSLVSRFIGKYLTFFKGLQIKQTAVNKNIRKTGNYSKKKINILIKDN